MGNNKHIITRDIRVGNKAAEDDDLLQECFVDNGILQEALDINCNGSVLLGRTGAGKSAIIKRIEQKEEKVSLLSLDDMSMNRISNSNIVDVLKSDEANLSLLFQNMWKHILIIEYIKLKYSINDKQGFFNTFIHRFKENRIKKRALEYLEKYKDSLWVETDELLQRWVSSKEQALQASTNIGIDKFLKLEAKNSAQISDEKTVESKNRIKNYIIPELVSTLPKVIALLAEDIDEKVKYYILLDKLDDEWVGEDIKYQLINALIKAVEKFRSIRDLKIIIAARSDVLEKAMQENRAAGFQKEKFEDCIIKITWRKNSLKELINKRIASAFRKKYSPRQEVSFADIFPGTMSGQIDSFTYLLERTLTRPRDIIVFVNMCLAEAGDIDSCEVYKDQIINAERKYSFSRYEALLTEWRIIYPNLDVIMSILKEMPEKFRIADVADEQLDNFLLKFADIAETERGNICRKAINLLEKDGLDRQVKENFLKCIFAVLYRVGAVGLKIRKTDKVQYSYLNDAPVEEEDVKVDTAIYVVKMLHSYMDIKIHGQGE